MDFSNLYFETVFKKEKKIFIRRIKQNNLSFSTIIQITRANEENKSRYTFSYMLMLFLYT